MQALAEAWKLPPKPAGVRVLGVDGFYACIKGQDRGMVVAVDMGTGKPVVPARIDERYRTALFAWLERYRNNWAWK